MKEEEKIKETEEKLARKIETTEIPEKDKKMGWVQKKLTKKTIKMARTEIAKMRAETTPDMLIKNRKKTIEALIRISKILEITNENGTEVTKEQWEKLELNKLLDYWEQAVQTLEENIR